MNFDLSPTLLGEVLKKGRGCKSSFAPTKRLEKSLAVLKGYMFIYIYVTSSAILDLINMYFGSTMTIIY